MAAVKKVGGWYWRMRQAKIADQKRPRVDENLPFGLRVGARVTLSEEPYLRELVEGTLLATFPGREQVVVGYGKFDILELTFHRFYLAPYHDTGGADIEKTAAIQVTVNREGAVDDLVLFKDADIIHPSTEEGWDVWLNEHAGIIGNNPFYVNDDDDIRIAEYSRILDSESDRRIAPLAVTEQMYVDPYQKKSSAFHVERMLMFYQRTLTDADGDPLTEWVSVSSEVDNDGARVRISNGLNVNQALLTVL